MREIKFRGKHIHIFKHNEDLDDWVYGYLTDRNYIYSPELEGEMLVDPKTVGQYTGLKDYQGKEIYEGDIVRHFDKTLVCGEVVFGKTPDQQGVGGGHPAFYVKWKHNSNNVFTEFWRNDLYYWRNRVEAIGNIHENKDLLKEEE